MWANRLGGLLQWKALLVLNSFCGHLTDRVKARLAETRTHLAVIPGGMTSILQPLDISVNQPFKVKFRRWYAEWMAADIHERTPTGRLKRALLQQVCLWILSTWRSMLCDTIVKSFKVTGIANRMDGTEDDYLWEGARETDSSSSSKSKSDNKHP